MKATIAVSSVIGIGVLTGTLVSMLTIGSGRGDSNEFDAETKGGRQASTRQPNDTAMPVLRVSSRTPLDFGTAWETERFRWSLIIDNPNDVPVTLTRYRTSCRCTSVSPTPLVIPANGSGQAELILNLTSSRDSSPSLLPYDFSVDLWPKMAGRANAKRGWTVHGRVQPLVYPADIEIDFGDFSPSEELLSRSIEIVVHDQVAQIEASDVTLLPRLTFTRIASSDEPAGTQKYLLECTLLSTELDSRPFEFEVPLTITTRSGDIVGDESVIVRGRKLSVIEHSPASLLFGAYPIGSAPTAKITIHTTDGSELHVMDCRTSSDELAIQVDQDRKTSVRYVVTLRPTTLGQRSETLEFRARSGSGMIESFSVPVLFFGKARSTVR